ncbi:MAG: ApeI family dehydratase [Candidatus Cyclobacteriaceae bacterium M2_1C_046]
MLKNKLYQIISSEQKDENSYSVTIKIDPSHEIFKGHFPQQPVLPGVCLLEMTKEILGELRENNYRFISASNIKYAKLVDPTVDDELRFELSVKEEADKVLAINVSSFLKDGSANYKMKGNFVPAG